MDRFWTFFASIILSAVLAICGTFSVFLFVLLVKLTLWVAHL